MRHLGPLCLFLAVIGFSMLGHGAESEGDGSLPLVVSLDYRVDDAVLGCPTLRDFERSVAAQVHYDPFLPEADLRLVTRIYRSPTGLEAELVWKRNDGSLEGERRLSSGEDCIELAKGMTFAVAVQIQLLTAEGDLDESRGALSSSTPAPRSASSFDSEPQRSAASESLEHPARTTLAIGAGPVIAFRNAPLVGAGGRVFARLGLERVDFELGGEAQLPVSYATASGGGFSMMNFDATFTPCVRAGALRACGVAVLGRAEVEGFGVEAVRRATSTVFRTGLRLRIDQPLNPALIFGAHIDGLVLVTPVTVYLRSAPVWTMPTFGAKAGIDLAVLFQ